MTYMTYMTSFDKDHQKRLKLSTKSLQIHYLGLRPSYMFMERIILNGLNGCVGDAPTSNIVAHVNYVAKYMLPGTIGSI